MLNGDLRIQELEALNAELQARLEPYERDEELAHIVNLNKELAAEDAVLEARRQAAAARQAAVARQAAAVVVARLKAINTELQAKLYPYEQAEELARLVNLNKELAAEDAALEARRQAAAELADIVNLNNALDNEDAALEAARLAKAAAERQAAAEAVVKQAASVRSTNMTSGALILASGCIANFAETMFSHNALTGPYGHVLQVVGLASMAAALGTQMYEGFKMGSFFEGGNFKSLALSAAAVSAVAIASQEVLKNLNPHYVIGANLALVALGCLAKVAKDQAPHIGG